MTNQLAERIMREGTVDTKHYRYTITLDALNQGIIVRLPLRELDTDTAWETVKVLGY